MPPFAVAPCQPRRWRSGLARVAVEPAFDAEVIELLAPDHAGVGLAHDPGLFVIRLGRPHGRIVFVGFAEAGRQNFGERVAEIGACAGVVAPKAQPKLDLAAGRHRHPIARRHFRAAPFGVDGRSARDDVVVDSILRVWRRRLAAEQERKVGLIFAEQELRRMSVGIKARREAPGRAGLVLGDRQRFVGGFGLRRGDVRPGRAFVPRPSVPPPERRQDIQHGRVRPGVADADADAKVERRGLGVIDGDPPPATVVEHARVGELELGLAPAAAGVLLAQPHVGKFGLRVVIDPAQPGGGRRRVSVPPIFLHVLAVIALGAGEAEQALLEERVAPVP